MTLRWADRTFRFDTPEALFPIIVERLRGTPARIEDKVRGLPPDLLTRRDGDEWSIQEHIGHLLDLDELHTGRLDDFLAGAEVLRAADMTNRKTWEAHHNDRPSSTSWPPFAASAAISSPASTPGIPTSWPLPPATLACNSPCGFSTWPSSPPSTTITIWHG
jgi:hypothetical protein